MFSIIFLDCEVFAFSDVSDEHTASVFRVTGLLQVDVKVIQSKKCVSDFGWFHVFGSSRIWKTRRLKRVCSELVADMVSAFSAI